MDRNLQRRRRSRAAAPQRRSRASRACVRVQSVLQRAMPAKPLLLRPLWLCWLMLCEHGNRPLEHAAVLPAPRSDIPPETPARTASETISSMPCLGDVHCAADTANPSRPCWEAPELADVRRSLAHLMMPLAHYGSVPSRIIYRLAEYDASQCRKCRRQHTCLARAPCSLARAAAPRRRPLSAMRQRSCAVPG